MNGKCFLVIGMTGQGKSTWIKNYLEKRPHYIFDVNNEYEPEGYNCAPLSTDKNGNRYPDAMQFINDCFKINDAVCVLEEATGFFRGSLSKDVNRLLVAKRHQRNDYIFVFHSIQSVPPQIFLLTNYVVLFKTNDNPKIVATKYPQVAGAFAALLNSPQYSNKILKLI